MQSAFTGNRIVAKSVVTACRISICAAVFSLVLWMCQVPQLKTWQAVIPAIALVTALFSIVAAIRWHHASPIPVGPVIGTSVLSAMWALAIAIGI